MLSTGAEVDRYVVLGEVGRGGMAVVYAVRHRVLGTQHALKLLTSPTPGLRDRLVAEGRVQAHLDPAHVVPVTDVLDVGGAPALLMPLVRGCSLAELLDAHRLSEPEVVSVFSGVLHGVATAHAAGVVHRDLKPANVLLEMSRGRVRVRVADFGLARHADALVQTQAEQLLGTPAYASPEQLTDPSRVDHRTDLWALGVLLYELLTGGRPFPQSTLASLVVAVERAAYPVEPVPPAWRDLVAGLLQPEPDRRIDSVDEVLAAMPGPDGAPLVVGTPIADRVQRTRDVTRAALDGVREASALAATVPPPDLPSHNLPRERDAFVGRAADLEELGRRLAGRSALVTVLGIGGTGKTRLVTHFGWQRGSEWPGGVWFCDLSEARSADGIAAAVGRALGVQLRDDPVGHLGWAIEGRGRCLLILDNFEQVARHASETLGRWLDQAPQAQFVVTSREVLGLPGEVSLALRPLDAADSVALFLARAADAKRGFSANAADLETIGELVALLDHLPLAVELAAARVRAVSPAKLLARMSDRFRVLASGGGRRDRQATLRATLDWSWDLLTSWERSALAQMSVFEGGFDLEAAEAVIDVSEHDEAPWAMDIVQALVDKSLVRTVADGRFDLLVSVQEYAAERLSASGAGRGARERHARWFAGMGTEAFLAASRGPDGLAARQQVAQELDNLVAATRRAVALDLDDVAAECLLASATVLLRQGPAARIPPLVARVMAMPALRPRSEATACRVAGLTADVLGRTEEAVAQHERAVALFRASGDATLVAVSLFDLGIVLDFYGRSEQAMASFEDGLEVLRAVGGSDYEGMLLGGLGIAHARKGRDEQADALLVEACARLTAKGNRYGLGVALTNLGGLRFHQGRLDEALETLGEALEVAEGYRDQRLITVILINRGLAWWARGELDAAGAQFQDALDRARAVGDVRARGVALGYLGALALEAGRLDEAGPMLADAQDKLRASKDPIQLAVVLAVTAWWRGLRGERALGQAVLAEAEAVLGDRSPNAGSEYGRAVARARAVLGGG